MEKETLILIGLTLLISVISIKITNKIFSKILKKNNEIHLKFFKNFLKAVIAILALYNIFNQFDAFESFASTILASSSLLVVVLGFAFQTSLEDFIAGVLISIFKPFNIGDRINLVNSGITGKIEDITIRHTIIMTFQNSRLIIPNSVMNKEIIENSHIIDQRASNFLDVQITYESDIKKAKEIITNTIINHPNVIDQRSQEDKNKGIPQVQVFIRNFADSGIDLRASVWTKNIDINFSTCSEIREILIEKFNENNISFSYPHNHILGDINIINKK